MLFTLVSEHLKILSSHFPYKLQQKIMSESNQKQLVNSGIGKISLPNNWNFLIGTENLGTVDMQCSITEEGDSRYKKSRKQQMDEQNYTG